MTMIRGIPVHRIIGNQDLEREMALLTIILSDPLGEFVLLDLTILDFTVLKSLISRRGTFSSGNTEL